MNKFMEFGAYEWSMASRITSIVGTLVLLYYAILLGRRCHRDYRTLAILKRENDEEAAERLELHFNVEVNFNVKVYECKSLADNGSRNV